MLIGSLARGEFAANSDIDLVVTGLDPAAFFRAGADADGFADGVQVDVIPAESASARMVANIQREGVCLYARS